MTVQLLTAAKCLLTGGHLWTAWQLYPRLIGAQVEWLRWERRCQRCRTQARRWFKVSVPAGARIPQGVKSAIPVERYLTRLGAVAPRPESLRDGPMPGEVAASLE